MELQVTKPTYDIVNKDSMLSLSNELAKLIKEKNLSTTIQRKEYVNVSGWQFAGSALGLMPIITEVTDLTRRGEQPNQVEYKYLAKCEVRKINTGEVVSTGIAICSSFERTKASFDEYAILSMAQTRAIGKAYRNLLAWLMNAAGFEATPAEEMDFANNTTEEPKKPTKKPVVEVEVEEYEVDVDRALIMGEIGKAVKVKELTDIYFSYKQFIDADPALIELLKFKKESIK